MNILRKAALFIAAFAALSAAAFSLDLPIENINGKDYYVYRVAPKETVYSIVRKLGITRDQLIEANPVVADGLRAGETLLFPADKSADKIIEEPKNKPEEIVTPVDTVAEPKPVIPQPVATTQEPADTISVAIILPFMLQSENMTKATENVTNFYRGFILAADSLSLANQTHVKIMTFDSEGSPEKVAEIISNPEVYNSNFIIAPDDASSINAIVAVTDSTDAMVLNLFAVKNDGYLTHESLMQGNISHDLMYETAITSLCKEFKDKKVIILNATDIPAEKTGFTSELAAKLISAGIPYEKLDYEGKLTEQVLAQLTSGKNYVFIPTSHSREALMRIIPALEDYKVMNPSATLFGFPEWVVLQGDIKERLHRLNTTIYSRFASDSQALNTKKIATSFVNAYGTPLDRSVPNQTLMGFDAAAWILRAAVSGADEPYSGVQNSFKFKEIEGGGFENTSLYFINFTPEGTLDIVLL